MDNWLHQLAMTAPAMQYIAIFGVLLISGFGLPLPEDLPLILGGYLAGIGVAEAWIMIPGAFISILAADAIMFLLGRRYGHYVPKLPLVRRFLTPKRFAKCEAMLDEHGGKFIFAARFLPSLRTAAMFAAGTLRVPYWKFVIFDGAAAAISVPTIMLLAWAFADQITEVEHWVRDGQFIALGVVVLVIVLFIVIKVLWKRKLASA